MENAFAYKRIAVDTLRSPNKSINSQGLATEKYCKESTITLLKSFEDVGSGSDFERPGWKAMETFIEAHPGKIRYLITTDLSRIGRNAFATFDKIRKLEKQYDITVLTAKCLKEISDIINNALQTKH